MSFNKVLQKYRTQSFSEKNKGERFERLMQSYLQTDPNYIFLFKNVWMWEDFPFKSDLGGNDTGIDLVAVTDDDEYWAIQCKCYSETAVIDKPSVDSFLSTSSRQFKNEKGEKVNFSNRLWISTTNRWGTNASETIKNQTPPVSRIGLNDLEEAPVDWESLESGITGELSRLEKKSLRPHQIEALEKTNKYFSSGGDRGKLIMACGTGKTFTSLRIAENETNNEGIILFLVPSIALLGQSLREWSADSVEPINPICICSDPEISRKKNKIEDSDSYSILDLALPASTNPMQILRQIRRIERQKKKGMVVVFSTYQSIEVISETQRLLRNEKSKFSEFDLVICDEAHRTTGVSISGQEESVFTKVHNNDFIKSKKRLYMTATPRLFSDDVKSKAAESDATLCSMDDHSLYGEEIYRIGFGEAVEKNLLSDYKVLILTLNESNVPPSLWKMIEDGRNEINSDDVSKLIGCINALSKRVLGDEGVIENTDPEPMKRAVAFCSSIAISERITETFNIASDEYISSLPPEEREKMVSISSKHIDGTMNAPQRDELLGWLKEGGEDNECRILTNVRCLSEGVDVPSLDSVLFLSARNSQVDVVQSVGRVMRRSPNKKYGYIVIPVIIPSNIEPSQALDDNERFKVVWSVLNALRAHDDRFNATINKIELNKKKPKQIIVGGIGYSFGDDGEFQVGEKSGEYESQRKEIAEQLSLQFQELKGAVFAKMVQKVGDRRYWEQWSKNVGEIAEGQVQRLNRLIREEGKHKLVFNDFIEGLRKNINPSLTEQEGIEMLSQHLITKPVFEALFEGYSFVKENPISVSMQGMLDVLDEDVLEKDTEVLVKFYESVKMRAAGIDNSEGKQRIIIELYDKFFKTAFPKMVEKLGIVYTPVECVDFIIHSVNDVLKKEFGRSISDENIHILDPFTGTGTFITRLLQSGLIEDKDLERKYKHEIHANEIVLLAYYIAAINIENAFHDATPDPDDGIGKSKYIPFDGIVLTDTFQLAESEDGEKLFSEMFPQNSTRVQRQKKAPLRVIIGNPPYSVGQKSANDNAQNQSYSKLDGRISSTYAKMTSATNKNSLYDSYIKAFRWSSDRLDDNGGVISFISNGAWLDGNSSDGFRKSLEKEFTSIYVFNLRGNQRTSGELSRKEGGKIFGSGSRTPISITLLVKNPEVKTDKATIYYHDIGDYLSQSEKLKIVSDFGSVSNEKMIWKILEPNEHGDWISKRNESFDSFLPLEPNKKFDLSSQSIFTLNTMGVGTSRDSWVINFSINEIDKNIQNTIDFYNRQVKEFLKLQNIDKKITSENFIDRDPKRISWSSSLIPNVQRGGFIEYSKSSIITSSYRPFNKQNLYFGDKLIHRRGQFDDIFKGGQANFIISISSTIKGLGLLITDKVADIHYNGDTQCFPLYFYEENTNIQKGLFDSDGGQDYIRRDGVSDFILERTKKQYGGTNITKEDIFYYVYGFLHSPEYQETFANDLKKMLPRLPLVDDVKDFWNFSKSGRQLADIHLNYESVEPYPNVEVIGEDSGYFKVEKMKFPKKDQKDTIIYNGKITIHNIPLEAYEYVVNGKSAIEWIMERYQITTHKESQITNDPNDWAEEVGNPRYILDLLLSIINVSMKTREIVGNLPKVKFD
jgi:predicted helicase